MSPERKISNRFDEKSKPEILPSSTAEPVLVLLERDPMDAVQETSIFPSSVKCWSVRVMLSCAWEMYSPDIEDSLIG